MNNRIAFILIRYTLEVSPTIKEMVYYFMEKGLNVDIYTDKLNRKEDFAIPGVDIKILESLMMSKDSNLIIETLNSYPNYVAIDFLAIEFLKQINIPSHKIIYFSFESTQYLLGYDKEYCCKLLNNCMFGIIQSTERLTDFRNYFNGELLLEFEILPVSLRSRKFLDKSESSLIGYSGYICEWSGLKEFLSIFDLLENQSYELYIQGHSMGTECYLEDIKRAISHNLNITLDQKFYTDDEHLNLLKKFNIGLALYTSNQENENWENLIFSSGKIANYLWTGCAIITNIKHSLTVNPPFLYISDLTDVGKINQLLDFYEKHKSEFVDAAYKTAKQFYCMDYYAEAIISRLRRNTVFVVFSKDRPLQLEASLNSLLQNVNSIESSDVFIIYKTSSSKYQTAYNFLSNQFAKTNFVLENDFKSDLIKCIEKYHFVVFLVDDNVFTNEVNLKKVTKLMDYNPAVLGFSLRLGENITYHYPTNSLQKKPEFLKVDDEILAVDWTKSEQYFGYSLEVSSSVYRVKDILPVLQENYFTNPNTFELLLAEKRFTYIQSHPFLMMYKKSRSFCIPANLVQDQFINRNSKSSELSPDNLLELFNQSKKIDLIAFKDFNNVSCHQEVPFQFKGKKNIDAKVSICIITYNRADLIKESIQSAINQTYTNIEIIIVDDGSTDHTQEVVEKFEDCRIKYYYKEHSGAPDTRNFAIDKSTGEFISWLDSDDILLPDTIKSHIEILSNYPDADLIYGNIVATDKNKNIIQPVIYQEWYKNNSGLLAQIIYQNPIPNIGTIIRKDVYKKVGFFNTDYRRAHDYEWLSRAVNKINFKYNCINTLLWRQHGENLGAGSSKKTDYSYELKIILNLIVKHDLEKLLPVCFTSESIKFNHAQALVIIAGIISQYGFDDVGLEFLRKAYNIFPSEQILELIKKASSLPITNQDTSKKTITFFINNVLAVTGGNQTLLKMSNELVRRNYNVNIITYSDRPGWFEFLPNHIKVPDNRELNEFVPESDFVISTYFLNTHELLKVSSPNKIYYAQGDQYLFDERVPVLSSEKMELYETFKLLSVSSYLHKDIKIIANSNNLARTIKKKYNIDAAGILPVGIDTTVYRIERKQLQKEKLNVLVVGPDVPGDPVEPLDFKGIEDIKKALLFVPDLYDKFTITRMSNSEKYYFNEIECNFFITPDNKQKQEIFSNADILIYASHYDSCPLPPLEAMTAGIAVICTDTDGAKEYCVNEYNSLLVPIKNPYKIAEALERLYVNADLRKVIIDGGFKTASEFTFDKMVERFETLLNKLAQQTK